MGWVLFASPGENTIHFSGYNWQIKTAHTPTAPHNNYFSGSKQGIEVDSKGFLHMRIFKTLGRWWCSEIISEDSFGYGTYLFHTNARLDTLDQNVIFAFFTWEFNQEVFNREIDIEFSRWGGQLKYANAQYVVQPFLNKGNLYRFMLELSGGYATHLLRWTPETLEFTTYGGHYALDRLDSPDFPKENILHHWVYTGDDIPEPGDENVRFNLYLFEGKPPSDNRALEVVIHYFEFFPFLSEKK